MHPGCQPAPHGVAQAYFHRHCHLIFCFCCFQKPPLLLTLIFSSCHLQGWLFSKKSKHFAQQNFQKLWQLPDKQQQCLLDCLILFFSTMHARHHLSVVQWCQHHLLTLIVILSFGHWHASCRQGHLIIDHFSFDLAATLPPTGWFLADPHHYLLDAREVAVTMPMLSSPINY